MQEQLVSADFIRIFSRHRQPHFAVDTNDGRFLMINEACAAMLELDAHTGLPDNISKLSHRGFPGLKLLTGPAASLEIMHQFVYTGSRKAREIRLTGSAQDCADASLFIARLEDISSRLAFNTYLIEQGQKNRDLTVEAPQLIAFTLELLSGMVPVKQAAAFFPGYASEYLYRPEEVDEPIAAQLKQVIDTTGDRTGENSGEINVVDLPGDLGAVLCISVTEEGEHLGVIALALPDRSALRPFALPPIQYLGQLLGEQLVRNRAKARIMLRLHNFSRYRDGTQLGVAVLDSQRRIAQCTAVFCDFFGLQEETLLGRNLENIRNLIRIPFEQEESRQIPVMYSYTKPDGMHVYFNITEIDAEEDSSMILLWDVSSVRRLEDELELARNQAEAAKRSKGDFISNISHELRTPLNGINGMAQLLEETSLDSEQNDLVETLRHSVENLNNLIQDLLDFSRLDSGKLKMDEDFFPVFDVLSRVVQNHGADAKAKGLYLRIDSPDSRLLYFSDAMRFQQIISNLVSNAIKFTDSGGVAISYVLEKHKLIVEVKDSGIGIPEKMQRRIFDSFTQLEHTYTKYRQGLGLGLAICRRLSVLMGGKLDLSSQVGAGSTFSLTLPAKEEQVSDRSQSSGNERRGPNARRERFPGLRVLVAEDDFLNRKTLVRFLKMQGCLVSAAGDGLEAEHLIRTMDFDILIFDITMPEITGQELTHLVRRKNISSRRDIPILGVTAHVYPGEIQSFLESGMNDVLTKPFVAAQLFEKMEGILQG